MIAEIIYVIIVVLPKQLLLLKYLKIMYLVKISPFMNV